MYTYDFKGEELSNCICKLNALKDSHLAKLLKCLGYNIETT